MGIDFHDLFFIGLSQPHNPSRMFGVLTWFFFLFNFIFQYFIDWDLDFIICFGLFFIRLFWSYDPSRGFSKLTRIGLVFLVLFNFFFNFILQLWVDWELFFIIYYDLLFMKLSQDRDCRFYMLTHVKLGCLGFASYKVILVSWPKVTDCVDWEFWFLNSSFNIVLSQSYDLNNGFDKLT